MTPPNIIPYTLQKFFNAKEKIGPRQGIDPMQARITATMILCDPAHAGPVAQLAILIVLIYSYYVNILCFKARSSCIECYSLQ